jgi:hypothetical protein
MAPTVAILPMKRRRRGYQTPLSPLLLLLLLLLLLSVMDDEEDEGSIIDLMVVIVRLVEKGWDVERRAAKPQPLCALVVMIVSHLAVIINLAAIVVVVLAGTPPRGVV